MALIDKLKAIGNAIREKTGITEDIPLEDMPSYIRSIQTVSPGDDSTCSIIEIRTTLQKSGMYYATAPISLPAGSIKYMYVQKAENYYSRNFVGRWLYISGKEGYTYGPLRMDGTTTYYSTYGCCSILPYNPDKYVMWMKKNQIHFSYNSGSYTSPGFQEIYDGPWGDNYTGEIVITVVIQNN